MHEMPDEERRAFLLEGTRTGKLATIRRDGRPHVVPIWFLHMGADRAEEFGRRNAVEGELLVRIRPTKILARAAIAD